MPTGPLRTNPTTRSCTTLPPGVGMETLCGVRLEASAGEFRGAGSVGQQAARPVRSAITGIHAGVHCIFPRKGCSGGRQRPPFTGGKGEVTEIQSAVLKFLGERPVWPRPPCLSHRCLPDVTLPPTPGEQQDGTRPRWQEITLTSEPHSGGSGPSLTHGGLISRRHQIPGPSISITDPSCKMNSRALCTVRGQRSEGTEAPTASTACPSAPWTLRGVRNSPRVPTKDRGVPRQR